MKPSIQMHASNLLTNQSNITFTNTQYNFWPRNCEFVLPPTDDMNYIYPGYFIDDRGSN